MPVVRKTLLVLLLLTAALEARAEIEPELKDFLAFPARLAIRGYQLWISPAKGSECPMVPSDSIFALQAIERYGIWQGGWLTVDRLHRCGHDLNFYPIVVMPTGLKFQDPVPPLEARK